jgi:hypothetical protein
MRPLEANQMVLRSEVIPSELLRTFLIIERTGSYTDAADRSCPGEWCNNGEVVVIAGVAGSIKPPPRRAA